MRKISFILLGVVILGTVAAAHAEAGPVPSTTAFVKLAKGDGCECISIGGPQGSTVKFRANVSDLVTGPEGLVIPDVGEPVIFTLGNLTQTGTTDDGGYATATFTLNVPAGSYSVEAAYDGDATLGASSATTDFTVRGVALAYTGPALGTAGSTQALSATLTYDGAGVQGETLQFQLGNQTVTGTTDSFGTAIAPITLAQAAGVKTLDVSFAGDGGHTPPLVAASDAAQFTIVDQLVVGEPVVAITSPSADGVLLSAPGLPESVCADESDPATCADNSAQVTSMISGTASSTFPIGGSPSCGCGVFVSLVSNETGVQGVGYADVVCDNPACTSGSWSYLTNFVLPPGTYTLTATATDASGGVGTATRNVVVV
ncbi:MAG: hypothetical protein ABR548_12110 [Actinomycetota bacterium]|nr:DUF5011 domain-containing protein [Actinomycetota bacterium]